MRVRASTRSKDDVVADEVRDGVGAALETAAAVAEATEEEQPVNFELVSSFRSSSCCTIVILGVSLADCSFA